MDNGEGSSSRKRVKGKRKIEECLPDDIILNILSRLPAKDVCRYRCVCRIWEYMTSTNEFMDLHLQHCIPAVIAEDIGLNRYIVDTWWDPKRKRSMINKFDMYAQYSVVFSQDGLIVFGSPGIWFHYSREYGQWPSEYYIVNPVSHEEVKICAPGQLCGIFFHPDLKEYHTIWQVKGIESLQYMLLNWGGTKPCWREIKNPWSYKTMINGNSTLRVGDFMYWIVDDMMEQCRQCEEFILKYDIKREEFAVMSHPGARRSTKCVHRNMNLLNNGGHLSLIQIISTGPFKLIIWELKDNMERIWTCCNYTFQADLDSYVQPIAVANGELLIGSYGMLYICNLNHGIARRLGGTYNYTKKDIGHFVPGLFFPVVRSIACLRNCKSVITVKDGNATTKTA